MTPTESPRTAPSLAREAIGLREVLFQSVTHMAPAGAVAIAIPLGASFAGGSLPLAVLAALIPCVFVAMSIGELAKHLPSAASFSTYATRGLHPTAGFLVAWGYGLVEAIALPLGYLFFAVVLTGTLEAEFGWPASLWWVWAVAAAVIVSGLVYSGIRVAGRVGFVLGLAEIAVFLSLALWLVVKAGDENTLHVFGTRFSTVGGFEGTSGIFAASVYAVGAFVGFEASAPLAEEARNPKATIRQAVVYSALAVGLFYVLATYAATVFVGPAKMAGFLELGHGNPWQAMAEGVWGGGWVLVMIALVTSGLAGANAAGNAASRTWFALGRIRLLPPALARVHPRWESPYVAVIAQFVLAVGLLLWLGFQFEPLSALTLLATVFVLVMILTYMVVNLACIAYYWRFRRSEASLLRHGFLPVLGIAAFLPAFLTAAGIKVFSFVAKLSYPVSLAGLVVGLWLLAGIAYLVYLHARQPERLAQTGTVFFDETAETRCRVADV